MVVVATVSVVVVDDDVVTVVVVFDDVVTVAVTLKLSLLLWKLSLLPLLMKLSLELLMLMMSSLLPLLLKLLLVLLLPLLLVACVVEDDVVTVGLENSC